MTDQSETRPSDGTAASSGPYLFELSGGNLALDFTNTVSRRAGASPIERVTDYGRLVSWGEQAGVLDRPRAARLRAHAEKHPRIAAAALRQAIEAREAIFAIFSSVAAGKPAPAEALETLNALLPRSFARMRLEQDGRGFSWRWREDGDAEPDLGAVLPPVVRAAAELLSSDLAGRVRECRAETCAWLFLDRSKNATRCWCDMTVCGNRAKARRHYAREKAARRSG